MLEGEADGVRVGVELSKRSLTSVDDVGETRGGMDIGQLAHGVFGINLVRQSLPNHKLDLADQSGYTVRAEVCLLFALGVSLPGHAVESGSELIALREGLRGME
jgi:hypothetical protein